MVVVDNVRLEKIPIEKLIPHPKNPRVALTKGNPIYEKLYTSIQHHTYIDPIVWNERTGYIVAGHQRFQVLKDMADEDGTVLKEIPVVVVNLSDKDELTYLTADNKIQGLWDPDKLSALFRELEDDDYAYTGFDDFEIASLIDDEEPDVGDDVIIDDIEPKGFSVTVVCESDDDKEFMKKLFNEAVKLKRRYTVSELRLAIPKE